VDDPSIAIAVPTVSLKNPAKFKLERFLTITFLRLDHENATCLGRSRRKLDAV